MLHVALNTIAIHFMSQMLTVLTTSERALHSRYCLPTADIGIHTHNLLYYLLSYCFEMFTPKTSLKMIFVPQVPVDTGTSQVVFFLGHKQRLRRIKSVKVVTCLQILHICICNLFTDASDR